ncbi:BnaC02g22870D [Brassica napus]|uniref:BnaC02g22870D protein n=1 Tax=Brassica napus TaxID=3708 RepID=A0A078HXF2_BRANA|nr:BnaC02g22870D [Brassica napus]
MGYAVFRWASSVSIGLFYPNSTINTPLHLDSIELPPTLTDLDLTVNRLSELDSRIAHLSMLKKLSLRQNLIEDSAVEPLSRWDALSDLEELILRDNKLAEVPDISIFSRVLVFDVSFNEITSLEGLSKASSTLKELYVSKNEVNKIMEIEHLHDLQILELGSNRLSVMVNMESLTKLEELWLGRNRIKVVNLCGLRCIKKISLQSNQLTSMKGFEDCVALEELYLSHNGISKMEGLSALVNLRVLDVSNNKLTSVDDIQSLTKLEDLWLNDNQIEILEAITEAKMDANVTANCVHPGIVRTRLTRDRDGLITDFVFFLTSKLLKSVPQAAATTCCLATSPRLRNVCGKYFSDCNEARTSNPDRAILKLRDCGLLRSCWSLQLPLPMFIKPLNTF